MITFFAVIFGLLYLLSALLHLGYFPLNGDEPRRAVVALEMLHSGNYIKPTTMGWDYYNKPPVYNWLISFFMKITGSTSEFPVRLPSVLFLLFWGFCHYRISRKLVAPAVALLSAVFLVTSIDIYFWGLTNGGEIDIFYSFIVYMQVMSMFYFNQQKNRFAFFIFSYAFCAIGFLTKGFPSIIFQGGTLIAICVFNRSIRQIFSWQHLAGIAVFLLLAGGYFYAYSFYGSWQTYVEDLLKEAFNKSALGEFQEKLWKKAMEYPVSFLKILMPWSLILLLLFKKKTIKLWSEPLVRFSILFILFNIAPYWFTGHPRMRYSYMFLPFALTVLAYIFWQYRESLQQFVQKVFQYTGILFIFILAAVLALPFFVHVNYVTWSIVSLLLLGYVIVYYRKRLFDAYYFAGGVIVVRLIYALVLIPVKYDKTKLRYDDEMERMAIANNYRPVDIYKKPDHLQLIIDLKVKKLDFGTIPAIPYMAYQVPYYYYQHTHHLVAYDTILMENKEYIGYRSELKDSAVEVLYSFHDPNQNDDDILLFRKKAKTADK